MKKNERTLHINTLLIALILLIGSCHSTDHPQSNLNESKVVKSLLGQDLIPMEDTEKTSLEKTEKLQIAREAYDRDSSNLDNIIWYGRRLAYRYQYFEAIDVYTKGLSLFPDSPELYRHRGHRYISIREFDKAIQDFEKAAVFVQGRPVETEADGIPNSINQPLSSLQFNIWYHWALSYYLKGDFENASRLFEDCMKFSVNDDLLVATTDWLYMSLRRNNKFSKATTLLDTIPTELVVVENDSYYKRLMMYKGHFRPEALIDLDNTDKDAQLDIVTQGYGVANYYYYTGEPDKAKEIFEKLLSSEYWSAFGYIAAEADMLRLF